MTGETHVGPTHPRVIEQLKQRAEQAQAILSAEGLVAIRLDGFRPLPKEYGSSQILPLWPVYLDEGDQPHFWTLVEIIVQIRLYRLKNVMLTYDAVAESVPDWRLRYMASPPPASENPLRYMAELHKLRADLDRMTSALRSWCEASHGILVVPDQPTDVFGYPLLIK